MQNDATKLYFAIPEAACQKSPKSRFWQAEPPAAASAAPACAAVRLHHRACRAGGRPVFLLLPLRRGRLRRRGRRDPRRGRAARGRRRSAHRRAAIPEGARLAGAAHSPARRLGAGVHWPDRGHGGAGLFRHAVPEPRPHHPQRLPCPDAPAAARCAAREHSAQRRRRGRCAGRQGYPAARQRHGGAGGRARALCAGRGAALSRARNADRRRYECGRPARRDRAPPAGPAGKRERHSRGHGTAQRQCRKRRLHRRSLLAVPDGDAAQLEHGAAGRLRHCEFSDGAAADSDRGSLDRGRTLGAAVCAGAGERPCTRRTHDLCACTGRNAGRHAQSDLRHDAAAGAGADAAHAR